jgi:hypothetical protein
VQRWNSLTRRFRLRNNSIIWGRKRRAAPIHLGRKISVGVGSRQILSCYRLECAAGVYGVGTWRFKTCLLSKLNHNSFVFLDLAAVLRGGSVPISQCSMLNGHDKSDSLPLRVHRSI